MGVVCRVRKNIISKLQIRLESKFLLEYRSEVAENEVPSQILDYLELGRKRVRNSTDRRLCGTRCRCPWHPHLGCWASVVHYTGAVVLNTGGADD